MLAMSTSPDPCFRTTLQHIECFNMILNMANSNSRLRPSVIHIRSVLAPGILSVYLYLQVSTTPQLIQNLQMAHFPSTMN